MATSPSDHDIMVLWSGWFVTSIVVGIIVLMVFVSVVSNQQTRKNPFNVYLIFLMIPDIILSFSCAVTCLANLLAGQFTSNMSCEIQGFYTVFCITANAWLNAVTCYQLYKMLWVTKQCTQTYVPPPRKLVVRHAAIVYLWAAFVACWGLFPWEWWPHKTTMFLESACLPVNVDTASTVFFYLVFIPCLMGIPFLYVLYVTYKIKRHQLLPSSGNKRLLSVYFLRLAAVFFIMWLPATFLMFILGPYSQWALWVGGLLTHLQGGVSAVVSLFKPDVYMAFKTFWTCQNCNLLPYHSNNQDEMNNSAIHGEAPNSNKKSDNLLNKFLRVLPRHFQRGKRHERSASSRSGDDDDDDDDTIDQASSKASAPLEHQNEDVILVMESLSHGTSTSEVRGETSALERSTTFEVGTGVTGNDVGDEDVRTGSTAVEISERNDSVPVRTDNDEDDAVCCRRRREDAVASSHSLPSLHEEETIEETYTSTAPPSLVPLQQALQTALNILRESASSENETIVSSDGSGDSTTASSNDSRLRALESVSQVLTTTRDRVSRDQDNRDVHHRPPSSIANQSRRPAPVNRTVDTSPGQVRFPSCSANFGVSGGGCRPPPLMPFMHPTVPHSTLTNGRLSLGTSFFSGPRNDSVDVLQIIEEVLMLVSSEVESTTTASSGGGGNERRSVRSSSSDSLEAALEETLSAVNSHLSSQGSRLTPGRQNVEPATSATETITTPFVPRVLDSTRQVDVSMLSSTMSILSSTIVEDDIEGQEEEQPAEDESN